MEGSAHGYNSFLTEDEPDPEPFSSGCPEVVSFLTEDEPDPEPFSHGCPVGMECLTEDEPDPEPFSHGCPVGVDWLTEDEPDPEPFNSGCPVGVDFLTEDEPDPEPFSSGCPVGVDWLTEAEPDPKRWAGSLRRVFSEACRSGEVDDHGETYTCATRLQPGRPVTGELWNDSGDDRDLFMFHLAELTTVEIASTGGTDTFGGLYDRYGYLLATADEGGDGRNFRMVKTLGPGWYFVRVEGRHQAEGAYRLSVDALR